MKTPKRISFYVKYTEDFTKELYDALWKWSKENNNFSPRNYDDSYEGLRRNKYYIFDNWGVRNQEYKKNKRSFGYGVDNNSQSCKKELSIQEVENLIRFKAKFEVGKWYRNETNGHYGKCTSYDDNFFYMNEMVYLDGEFKNNGGYSWLVRMVEKSETPWEEIQQYLLDKYFDKINLLYNQQFQKSRIHLDFPYKKRKRKLKEYIYPTLRRTGRLKLKIY